MSIEHVHEVPCNKLDLSHIPMYVKASSKRQCMRAHANAGGPSGVRVLNFGLSIHLHPYFVCASSEDSGEPLHLHRLA